MMLKYEYVPNGFGIGIMVPILKPNENNKSDSTDDYRGASINPIVSKLFEMCLLDIFNKYLVSSNRQFGFKSKSSCAHAIYSARITAEYFINRDSTVNLCAIDMQKAFDKMNKYALFLKLMNCNCPIILLNLLDCWYSKVFAKVKWGNCFSHLVQLISGTRQGGLMSPTLFAIFINDILVKLEASGLGCFIRNVCFNSFMYADDLLLLSISMSQLQKMLNICFEELDSLDMKISVKQLKLATSRKEV